MATGLHSDVGTGEIHIVYQWSYADAAARTGATGLGTSDEGKIARQADNDSFWVLTDSAGPTWVQIDQSNLGTIATQDANAVAITGGTIAGTGFATGDIDMTGQILTLDDDAISGDKVSGGTIGGSCTIDGGTLTGCEVSDNTLHSNDSTSGATALQVGGTATEGLELKVFEETVTGATVAAEDLNIDFTGYILSVQANLETLITGAGGCTAIGVGVAADPDQFGETSGLTKNLKIDSIANTTATAMDIQVYATDGAGNATGTFAGDVRVRIVYWATNSLDDAV